MLRLTTLDTALFIWDLRQLNSNYLNILHLGIDTTLNLLGKIQYPALLHNIALNS